MKTATIPLLVSFFLLVSLTAGCESPQPPPLTHTPPSTVIKRLIIVSIDGPRYSDTWGLHRRVHIPKQAQYLAPQGVLFTQFHNNGLTKTVSGHVALTTGTYEYLENAGNEYPSEPSLFQLWLKRHALPPEKAIIVTSKRKLAILNNCKNTAWRDAYRPIVHAVEKSDKKTMEQTLSFMDNEQPDLLMVHFKGVDAEGHAGNWEGYLEAIRETDQYVYDLWQKVQESPYYKDQTALWITNDHGRHLDGISDGFAGHGDQCEGCRHISLLALGPQLPKGLVVDTPYETIDLLPTVGSLFGFSTASFMGQPILELVH